MFFSYMDIIPVVLQIDRWRMGEREREMGEREGKEEQAMPVKL